MKPFEELTVFEKVADLTIPGDEVILPGGHVFYRVETVRTGPEWQGVRALRTEINAQGGSSSTTEDISSKAWRDIVAYACAAWRRT